MADQGGLPSVPSCILVRTIWAWSQLSGGHSWDVLIGYRSVICFRSELVTTGHINGHRSRATVQQCIFCNKPYTITLHHVLFACVELRHRRAVLEQFLGRTIVEADIFTDYDNEGRSTLASLCEAVDSGSKKFWRS